LLDELAAAGLVGVEVDHPGHEPEVATRWRQLASGHDLVITGASDFHGERKDLQIGACTTPAETVEQLRAMARNAPDSTVSGSPTWS
jgi:3',5'-nucleoside bisphosphate phosphatase